MNGEREEREGGMLEGVREREDSQSQSWRGGGKGEMLGEGDGTMSPEVLEERDMGPGMEGGMKERRRQEIRGSGAQLEHCMLSLSCSTVM